MKTENIVNDEGQVKTCYVFTSYGDLYINAIKANPLTLDAFHRYCGNRLKSDKWNGEYNQGDMYDWWKGKHEEYLGVLEGEGVTNLTFPEAKKDTHPEISKATTWNLDTPELFTLVFRMFPEYFPSTARYEDILEA